MRFATSCKLLSASTDRCKSCELPRFIRLHIYTRMVSPLEERKIVHNAEIRNRMNRGSTQDMQRAVEAESNLQDVANLIGSLHRRNEARVLCSDAGNQ